jgi:hypothetical protein
VEVKAYSIDNGYSNGLKIQSCADETLVRTSTSGLINCYSLREEAAMTEFETITTILAGITAFTSVVAVYLQARSQKKDRQ